MEKKTRIAKWDNVKLFLIACVVVGHLLAKQVDKSMMAKQVYYCIYLFHMPAFVIVSGLFAKRAIRQKSYDKAFRFLLLYLFIRVFMFGVRFIISDLRSIDIFTPSGISWYAFAIFVFYLLTMFLQQYNKWYVMGLAVIMSCAAGYDSNLGMYLSASRIFVYYPFFLLGFYVDPDKVVAFGRKHWVKIAAAVFVAAVFLFSMKNIDDIYWTLKVLKGKEAYSGYAKLKAYGSILRLMHFIGASLLSFSIFVLIPERKFFFSVIGQRTVTIYSLHYICIDIFYGMMKGGKLVRQLWPSHPNILIVLVGLLMVVILAWKPLDQIVTWLISPKKAVKEPEHKA